MPGPSQKEVPIQTDLIQGLGQVISGTEISKQGTIKPTENRITLIVGDQEWETQQFGSNILIS